MWRCQNDSNYPKKNVRNMYIRPTAMGCQKILYYNEGSPKESPPKFWRVLREKKGAQKKNGLDYYPGGSIMPGRSFSSGSYRYGYQGSEKDDEIAGAGNNFNTFFRQGDTRLLRWWSVDPKGSAMPGQSPYNYMDGNPIWFNDPLGDYVDGDKKGKKNYKKYRKEVNARIGWLEKRINGTDPSSDKYSELNEQFASYNQINSELDALEKDDKNLYFISSDVSLGGENGSGKTAGLTYFKGMTDYEGKNVRQINIDLSRETFPMSNLAHEFKHAFQFFEGRVVFSEGTKGGFNSQELEHEAFERGNRFSGKTLINNNRFNPDYSYNRKFIHKKYEKLPPTVPAPHGSGLKQYEWRAKKTGVNIIYNK
jgi:RHS repeat-associated protein